MRTQPRGYAPAHDGRPRQTPRTPRFDPKPPFFSLASAGVYYDILSSIQQSAYDVQAPPFREEDQVFNPYVDHFINSRTEDTIKIAVTAL